MNEVIDVTLERENRIIKDITDVSSQYNLMLNNANESQSQGLKEAYTKMAAEEKTILSNLINELVAAASDIKATMLKLGAAFKAINTEETDEPHKIVSEIISGGFSDIRLVQGEA